MRHLYSSWVLLALSVVCLQEQSAQAQSVTPEAFAAWAVRNNYQPGRDFRSYLNIAPGNMGPNALPVLPTVRGQVDSVLSFRGSLAGHTQPGDQALDITLSAALPFGRRASLGVWYTLREWYTYEDELAVERNALRPGGAYAAAGDVYVAATFQIFRQARRGLDAALRATIKTASGGDVEGLRFTDSPGYAFDASLARTWRTARGWSWRPYCSGGFYVWQRFGAQNPQNDAGMYALGIQLSRKPRAVPHQTNSVPLSFRTELAGYAGYTGNQDAPLVARAATSGPCGAGLAWELELQQGLNDVAYTSLRASLQLLLWDTTLR